MSDKLIGKFDWDNVVLNILYNKKEDKFYICHNGEVVKAENEEELDKELCTLGEQMPSESVKHQFKIFRTLIGNKGKFPQFVTNVTNREGALFDILKD